MSTLFAELSARAKALSTEDRARLVEELLDSLHGESDADADAAWACKIERRVAEVESGAVRLIPAEHVHAEARRLIRL
jgi:putative addiction module component (TIGR02574 family)